MRGQLTTRNISAALKLAKETGNYATDVSYDRKSGTWNAWRTDEQGHSIGLTGQGKDPIAAVEAMIQNNKNNEE